MLWQGATPAMVYSGLVGRKLVALTVPTEPPGTGEFLYPATPVAAFALLLSAPHNTQI